jgi:hypothetical protein
MSGYARKRVVDVRECVRRLENGLKKTANGEKI